jgi:hypothetical protein
LGGGGRQKEWMKRIGGMFYGYFYYLAAQLSQKLQLPYDYNVKDSNKLIHNLENLQIDGNTRLLF